MSTSFQPPAPLRTPFPTASRNPSKPRITTRPNLLPPKTSAKANLPNTDWPTITPREKRVVLVPNSWHNKTGQLIRQLNDNVWVIERGYIFLRNIDVGGRTTIIRLPNAALFVHSPLALTPPLKQAIDKLGRVAVVVAPNTEHLDFIKQWHTFYPQAVYLGPPGSLRRLSHLPFNMELSRNNVVHPKLDGSGISQFFISCAPFFNETVFVHAPSKSLICADLFWAYPTGPDVPPPTLAWGWAMNNVYKPVYDRILVKDRHQFATILRQILDSGFDRIIPCHGDIIESDGQKTLTKFFRQLLAY